MRIELRLTALEKERWTRQAQASSTGWSQTVRTPVQYPLADLKPAEPLAAGRRHGQQNGRQEIALALECLGGEVAAHGAALEHRTEA